MAEGGGKKFQDRPEQDELAESASEPEGVVAQEIPIENPGQKREREYRENTAWILERATQYIKEQRREKLPPVLPVPQELPESVPLPTLDTAREQWQKSRGRFSALKEGTKRLKMRFAGVENPDDLTALIYYLEQDLVDEEERYIHVKASRKDREIEKYKRKGYEVHDTRDSHRKGEVQFEIQKEIPYRVSPREAEKLAGLLGRANDPVEMIERLKRFGFKIEAHTIGHQFGALRDFVASPEINEVLERFERAGFKSDPLYFGYDTSSGPGHAHRYAADRIKEYASDSSKQAEVSDENLLRIVQLKQMGFGIVFGDYWDEAIKMVSDDDAFMVLTFMAAPEQRGVLHKYSQDNWSETLMFQDAGLTSELAEIIRTSPWLAGELLYEFSRGEYYRYSPEEREEKKIEKINTLLALPRVREMRSDPALAEFVENATLLRGSTPSLQNMESYAEFRQYPAAVPLLELFRELDIRPFQIQQLHQILKNQEILHEVFTPEFKEFVLRMKEGLGYKIQLEDFSDYFPGAADEIRAPAGGWILGLFHNPYWREGIVSGRAVELIKKFGDFHAQHVQFYTDLMKIPGSLDVISRLQEKLGFDFTDIFGSIEIRFDISHFRLLCEDEDLQKELFDDRTVAFYERLQEAFGYKPNLGEASSLIAMSQDAELSSLLAYAEVRFLMKDLRFITEASSSIEGIREALESFRMIKEKNLIEILSGYKDIPQMRAFIFRNAGLVTEDPKGDFSLFCRQILNNSEKISTRKSQMVHGELVGVLLDQHDYDALWKIAGPESEDPEEMQKITEKLRSFVEAYRVSGKGQTIVTLLAMRECEKGQNFLSLLERIEAKLDMYRTLMDQYTAYNIPDGLRASIGMEYEITTSTAEGYRALTEGDDLREDMTDVSRFAHVGRGRDAVFEIATKPVDNPYLVLLEMQLLQDIEFIDLNFERTGYERGARGYHLTIGGEQGVDVGPHSNFLQNTLVMSGWGGVNAGASVGRLSGGRSTNIRQRNGHGDNLVSIFENMKPAVEFRSLSIDRWEPFERTAVTSYYGAIAVQAYEKYLVDFDVKEFVNLKADTPEQLYEVLDQRGLLKEDIDDIKVKQIIFEWMRLQTEVLSDLSDHNANFLENEMDGYTDDRGRWVDAEEFGGSANRKRFIAMAGGEEGLRAYVQKTNISPDKLFVSATPDLANACTAITNLFIKSSGKSGGDTVNAASYLDTTKIGSVVEDSDPRAKSQSFFDTQGKVREGYYYMQGGSERMLLHSVQARLLRFNSSMQRIIA